MDITYLLALGIFCSVSLISAQQGKAVLSGGGQAGPAYKVAINQGTALQQGAKSKKRIRRPLVPTTTPLPTITTKIINVQNTTDYYYYYDVTTENSTDVYYYYDITTGATTTATTRATTTQPPPPSHGAKKQQWKKQNQGQAWKKQQQPQQQPPPPQPQQQQQQQKQGQQQVKRIQNKQNQQNNLNENIPVQKQQPQQKPKQSQKNQSQQQKPQQQQQQQQPKPQQIKKPPNKIQQPNKQQGRNKNQANKNPAPTQGHGMEGYTSTMEPALVPTQGHGHGKGHGKGPQLQKEITTGSPYPTVTPYYLRTTAAFSKPAVTTAPTGDVCFSTQDCEIGCCFNRQNQLLDVDNYGPGGPKEGRDTGRCKQKAPGQGEPCDDFCMCDEAAGFVCYRRYVPDMKEAMKMAQNPQYEGPEFPVLPPRKCTNSTFVTAERQSFWKCYFDVACSGGIEASGGAA